MRIFELQSETTVSRLNELFNRDSVRWSWEENTHNTARALFVVKHMEYEFLASATDKYSEEWEIQFAKLYGEEFEHGLTKTGNAAVVMATVVDIMRDFLKTHPEVLIIKFDAKEPSRRSLYTKMITRLLPSWSLSKSNDGAHFVLTAPDTDEFN